MEAQQQFNVKLPASVCARVMRLANKVDVAMREVALAALQEFLPKYEAVVEEHFRSVPKPLANGQAVRRPVALPRPVGRPRKVSGPLPFKVGQLICHESKCDGKRYLCILQIAEYTTAGARCVVVQGRGTERTLSRSQLRLYKPWDGKTTRPAQPSAPVEQALVDRDSPLDRVHPSMLEG